MKVKTNLTADELELVSRGLSSLAKSQRADGKFVPNNPAEKELLDEVDSALDTMLGSLSQEVATLFRGE
jgi:hypothetical protein